MKEVNPKENVMIFAFEMWMDLTPSGSRIEFNMNSIV